MDASRATSAAEAGFAIASHDDDTPEKWDPARPWGRRSRSFRSIWTARAARARGMSTVFGAPNILRGKSQFGAIGHSTR